MEEEKKHLPLFGVGPIIVFGQVIFTAVAIIIARIFNLKYEIEALKVPFLIIGILFLCFGFYLDLSAKFKSKLFKNVEDNKLITDGVYAITRNPVYSCAFLLCFGAILISNNLLLFFVPIICWIYMTIFWVNTEEKWLKDLYGQEYIEYCKKFNRCIPWFQKK